MKKKLKRNPRPPKQTTLTYSPPEYVPPSQLSGPDPRHPRLVGTLLGRLFNHVKMMDGTFVLAIATMGGNHATQSIH